MSARDLIKGENLDRPVIIVGAPRSGTTLLSRLLEAHPDLHLIGEPRVTWRHGNERKTDMLSRGDARPKVKNFIRNAFAAETLGASKQRFVEKSPHNSLRLDFVKAVYPNARIVHIIRDGRESTVSIRDHWQRFSVGIGRKQLQRRLREVDWKRAPYYAKELFRRALPESMSPIVGRRIWGPQIPGLSQLAQELELIEVCAIQWRTCVEAACHQGRRLAAGDYMECRFEDFSLELIREVLRFCELSDADEVWEEYESRFKQERQGSRKGQASDEDMQRMMNWIAPTLSWLGYEE